MAPAKRGAPASTKQERPKKLTRKEKSAVNKARLKEVNATVLGQVREHRAATVQDWPRKKVQQTLYGWGGVRIAHKVTPYTNELDAVLFRLLSTGTSLDTISTLKGLPDLCELLTWLGEESHAFAKTFLRARELVIPLYEDRALSLALTPQSGVVTTRRGVLTKDGDIVEVTETRKSDAVERSKLALSAYQWALGWLAPKKHGPKPIFAEDNTALKDLLGAFRERSKNIESQE